jgi:HPt (histidine-containing phosphotransfer) domain-containing protein
VNAIDKRIAQDLAAALSREEFLRLLQTFDADLGRLARECAQAAEADDAPALRRAAHSLAGAAAGIGAHRLEAAARLAMPGAPAQDHPPQLVARIREETEAVLAELAALARPPTA